jgi:hypothetical protein
MSTYSGALEAIDRVLNRGGEPQDVLRQVVSILHRIYPYVAIAFVEEGELAPGPQAGQEPSAVEAFPIVFQGSQVAELRVAGAPVDLAFLDRVATIVSPYCLAGWDGDD